MSIGGVLYVGGLTWLYRFSPNPFDGALDLTFTVRNDHQKALDGKATFWLTNVFGGAVGIPANLDVLGIQPHEARAITATIRGVSQWTFVTARATFTTPAEIGGVALSAVTRQVPVFVLPWAILLTAALVAAWLVYRILRRRQASRAPSAISGDLGAQS